MVYSKMADVADELPDHAPRFILLSYPLSLVRCFFVLPSLSLLSPFPLPFPCALSGLVQILRLLPWKESTNAYSSRRADCRFPMC